MATRRKLDGTLEITELCFGSLSADGEFIERETLSREDYEQGRSRGTESFTAMEREMIHLSLGTTKIEDYLKKQELVAVEDVDDVDEFEQLERLHNNLLAKEVKTTTAMDQQVLAEKFSPAEIQAMKGFTTAERAGINQTLNTTTNTIPENTEEGIRQLPIWKAFSHHQVPVTDNLINALVDEHKIGKLIEQQAAKVRKEKESKKHSRTNNYFALTREYRLREQEATEECDRLISKQYRKVSLKLHPDKYGDLYETEFSELLLAYDILKDCETRQNYVQQLLKVMATAYRMKGGAGADSASYILQAHLAFFSNHFTEQTQDTAQARFQKQMATTSQARYDPNQMPTKSTQNAQKMKSHYYLEANVYQTPPKAIHITNIQGLTVAVALPPPSCPSNLIHSISIYSENDNDDDDHKLLLTVMKPDFSDSEGEEQWIPVRLQLPQYGIYQLYWKVTLKVDQFSTNLIETPPSTTREVDLEHPRTVKARQELPGLLHHGTQLIASLRVESRKLNNNKSTQQQVNDNIENQYWQLHELIAKSRTISNRLWRCLETLGYSYEEALDYNNKNSKAAKAGNSGILEKLLTWIDICGREKSTLDDRIQVVQKKASLKSFQRSVATMMEEGQLAEWILRVQETDLNNTGAEVNRLYQLLTEGKKAKSNALWVDSISLQNAATRTDLFSKKQCQTLMARASEVEAKMLEETQRLLAAKQLEDQKEAERQRMEQQVAELNGLPLRSAVVLHDLVSRTDLNGRTGIYMGLAPGNGGSSGGNNRYIVRVGGIDMALQKKNFCPLPAQAPPPEPVLAPSPAAATTTASTTKKPTTSVKTAPASSKSDPGKSKTAAQPSAKKIVMPAKKAPQGPTAATATKTAAVKPKAPVAPAPTLNLKWAEKPIKNPVAAAAPPPKLNAQQQQGLLLSKPGVGNRTNHQHNHHKQQQATSSTKEPLPFRKVTMWIPQKEVSAFIGKKGSNVKAMNAESGAHIKVDKFKTNNRGCCAVYLEGKPTEIVAAQMCVERFLQERCNMAKKDVSVCTPAPTPHPAVAPSTPAQPGHNIGPAPALTPAPVPAPLNTFKSAPKADTPLGHQTPTTVSIPESISILPTPASGEDASGVTDTMENAAPIAPVAASASAAAPNAAPSSQPNQMDNLFLFLCQQATSLKCKPEVFYEFLRDQDIENLSDLNEAVNDDDFLREMQSSGLKGFKKAAFKRAVATAASDTNLIIIPTVDNGLNAPADAGNNNIHMELECPICYELMVNDPVLASDGYTYERHAIESWFEKHRGSPDGIILSPKTHSPMKDLNLVPNRSILAMARNAAAARNV